MTTVTDTAPEPTPGRALNITLWVVQILLAALYAFAGINKLLALQPEVVEGFAKIGLGQWFRYLTGGLELAGAIGLLIPRLAGPAALGLAGVMVGAVFAHVLALPPVALAVVPAVLFVLLVLIARARWKQSPLSGRGRAEIV
jgi:uncharacterized membrane protein YphA (DoxX/SURF4 family)